MTFRLIPYAMLNYDQRQVGNATQEVNGENEWVLCDAQRRVGPFRSPQLKSARMETKRVSEKEAKERNLMNIPDNDSVKYFHDHYWDDGESRRRLKKVSLAYSHRYLKWIKKLTAISIYFDGKNYNLLLSLFAFVLHSLESTVYFEGLTSGEVKGQSSIKYKFIRR